MINTRVGVSAGSKTATYHENQTKVEIPDTSFHTKGMLRNLIEIQCYEIARLKADKERLINEIPVKIKELETRNHFLYNENHSLRVELIGYRMKIINEYKEDKGAFMEIAG